MSGGKTPYERRFGEPIKGPIIPFGSLVEYHPVLAKDQSRIHQFGKKVLPGLFLGYALYAGRIWKGDVLVLAFEELETMDASEIYSKRLNAKEVIFPKEKGEFIFQSQMDESNILRMHENCEGSISLTQRTRSSKKPSRMLVKKETSLAPAMPCLAVPCKIMKKNCGSGGSNKVKNKT